MNETKNKLVAFEVWGCQMNVADAESMLHFLEEDGYTLTEDVEKADIVVLHTCSIREKARHKLISRLGIIKRIKDTRVKEGSPSLTIVVSGCVIQSEGMDLVKKLPFVDVFIGAYHLDEIRSLVKQSQLKQEQVVSLSVPENKDKECKSCNDKQQEDQKEKEKDTRKVSTVSGKNEVTRFVNIVQGCNNYCSYCIVPFSRGEQRSISKQDILDSCEQMILSGAKEIMLLGQNVNSYGLDTIEQRKQYEGVEKTPFVSLVEEVLNLDIQRLRFTTSNPYDFPKSLADLFFKTHKLGRYIHLPVQSGSDSILQKMNRKITIKEYKDKIEWLRSRDRDFAISTDIIVGFPGETDDDFESTCSLLENIRFSFAFAFKYSPRIRTVAARWKNQIPEDIKEKRLAKLNSIQDRITVELNEYWIDKEVKVLFNYESAKEKSVFYGRDQYFRLVRVKSSKDLVGSVKLIKIISADKTALEGIIVD